MHDAPTYAEPWQAALMAAVFALQQHGVIEPTTFAQALAARRRTDRDQSGQPDTYFEDVLSALEEVLLGATDIDEPAIVERIAAWRAAYLATPHGQPVQLTDAGSATTPASARQPR